MTDFITISEAKEALKGSFVGTVIKIGGIKAGTNAKGDWTMKIITIEDATASVEMAVFNEEITKFKLGYKYEITNPWWKMKDNKLSLNLGQYATVKAVGSANTQATTEQAPSSDEYLKQKQAEIDKKESKIPKFTDESNQIIDKESITLFKIKHQVNKCITEFEDSPNQGMIWEMTKIIYDRHWKTLLD